MASVPVDAAAEAAAVVVRAVAATSRVLSPRLEKNNTQYLFIFGNKIQLYWRVRKRKERIRRLSTS